MLDKEAQVLRSGSVTNCSQCQSIEEGAASSQLPRTVSQGSLQRRERLELRGAGPADRAPGGPAPGQLRRRPRQGARSANPRNPCKFDTSEGGRDRVSDTFWTSNTAFRT